MHNYVYIYTKITSIYPSSWFVMELISFIYPFNFEVFQISSSSLAKASWRPTTMVIWSFFSTTLTLARGTLVLTLLLHSTGMSSSSSPWKIWTLQLNLFWTVSKYPSILPAVPHMMLWSVCHAALCVWQQKPFIK